ncbi:MAG: ArsR/SmtB family transcription factor [Methanomassiliicoccales archaeon]
MAMTKECGEEQDLPDQVAEILGVSGGVSGISESLPDQDHLEERVKVHKALSDLTRMRILHALRSGGLCPCILKEVTGATDSRLSYHLGILERAGLIRSSQVRNWRIYRLTDRAREIIDRG